MANGTLAASQIEMLSQSGTGIITITPPATNTNRAITLPDAAGAIVVSGTTPSLNGIAFPATQVASAGANTLDDYEEGTWTPVLSGGSGSITTQTGTGTYQKIGNMVYTTGTTLVSNVGTVSGGGFVSGLPFTNSAVFSGCGVETAVNGKSLAIRRAGTGATSYDMNYFDNAGLCNGITNGSNFIFHVYYQTSQ